MYVPWRLGQAEPGESARWSCVDGRWVSVSLGQGAEAGQTIVANSEGDRELVQDHEAALELAKKWRV
jgi:hypothetical protein